MENSLHVAIDLLASASNAQKTAIIVMERGQIALSKNRLAVSSARLN